MMRPPVLGDVLEQTRDTHDGFRRGMHYKVTMVTDRCIYHVVAQTVPGGWPIGRFRLTRLNNLEDHMRVIHPEYVGELLFD